VVVIENEDNLWNSLMEYHWPRIFRYLAKSQTARYRLLTMPSEWLTTGSYAKVNIRSDWDVEQWFHPVLLERATRLLIGTLAHEGLHMIRFGVSRHRPALEPYRLVLHPEQTQRLLQSHWTSLNHPPGYGALLNDRLHWPLGEIGVELLTNKLLINRGLEPLTRTLPNGDYAGV
jgi:hypothetical protein